MHWTCQQKTRPTSPNGKDLSADGYQQNPAAYRRQKMKSGGGASRTGMNIPSENGVANDEVNALSCNVVVVLHLFGGDYTLVDTRFSLRYLQ